MHWGGTHRGPEAKRFRFRKKTTQSDLVDLEMRLVVPSLQK